MRYKHLCNFPHFQKCDNYVITPSNVWKLSLTLTCPSQAKIFPHAKISPGCQDMLIYFCTGLNFRVYLITNYLHSSSILHASYICGVFYPLLIIKIWCYPRRSSTNLCYSGDCSTMCLNLIIIKETVHSNIFEGGRKCFHNRCVVIIVWNKMGAGETHWFEEWYGVCHIHNNYQTLCTTIDLF